MSSPGTPIFTVNYATTVLTWNAPGVMDYGTLLSSTQLDATANVPGTFTYSPAAGTILGLGVQTLTVSFTPTDTTDFPNATATVTINVEMPSVTTFAYEDTVTQGTWIGIYGSQGYNVIGNAASLPAYATVTPSGQSSYTWASNTTDPRALQDAAGTGRIAAAWYLDYQLHGEYQPHRRSDARPGLVLPRLGYHVAKRAGADHQRGHRGGAFHSAGLVVPQRHLCRLRGQRRYTDYFHENGRCQGGVEWPVPRPGFDSGGDRLPLGAGQYDAGDLERDLRRAGLQRDRQRGQPSQLRNRHAVGPDVLYLGIEHIRPAGPPECGRHRPHRRVLVLDDELHDGLNFTDGQAHDLALYFVDWDSNRA